MSIAQEIDAPPSHKNERGLSFSLATAGLGLGGFYRKALPHFIHLGVNLEFFILRDDKEFEFIDNFGRAFKINDVNRFFTIPLTVELKKRMFTNDIEDDFRPHILAQAGVIYGMNFPRDIFVDEDVVKPKNQFEFTYNFIVGIGVDVTTRENYFFTIRTQYRYVFFPEIIAGKRNHSAFEIKLELGGQL
ncbi:MAG: hypothetical protein D6748_07455 [Calditrichaeota bacterium]|nr:MAG: hypothetical protein D6748_07455 [Calditrichota bacterium]